MNKKIICIVFMFLLVIGFTQHFECELIFGQETKIGCDIEPLVPTTQDRSVLYDIVPRFTADTIVDDCSYEINLQWTKVDKYCITYIRWSTCPIRNVGEGYPLYSGYGRSFIHENILANTQYYYSAWSRNINQYSFVGVASALTPYDSDVYWDWAGHDSVTEVDNIDFSGDNPSGITYQPKEYVNGGYGIGGKGVMWCARNNPSKIYKLVYDGEWASYQGDGWEDGKYLSGNPDAEGIAMSEWDDEYIYVCSEKNDGRYTIRRYPIMTTGTQLDCTHKWELDDFGDFGNPNKVPYGNNNNGFEALTWVPDDFLEERGFWDESMNKFYNGVDYPYHGSGVFFVGMEHNGKIYAYALNHSDVDDFTKIATIDSGEYRIMGLEFDRETGLLWANSDNSNGNRIRVLEVDDVGCFVVTQRYHKPSTLSDVNNEGIAFFPEAEGINGYKNFFWIDDDDTGGYSLRMDDIPCGPRLVCQ